MRIPLMKCEQSGWKIRIHKMMCVSEYLMFIERRLFLNFSASFLLACESLECKITLDSYPGNVFVQFNSSIFDESLWVETFHSITRWKKVFKEIEMLRWVEAQFVMIFYPAEIYANPFSLFRLWMFVSEFFIVDFLRLWFLSIWS